MSEHRIAIGEHARDFTLEDTRGQLVRLSDYEGSRNVYLVLNRGFS
jgi:peroxiredoxin